MRGGRATHAVIVGNGIAGYTAALRLRHMQPEWRITMVSGESTFPFSRPALMYVFLGHMRYQDTKPYEDRVWRDVRIDLVRAWVEEIDVGGRRLSVGQHKIMEYDRLLLALGSKPNKFGWPGQDLDGVQGFYSLADLDRMTRTLRRTRRAVIVGGGLIGIELAEMLHSRGIPVTLLVRESSYWNNILPKEESEMVTALIRAAGFDLRLQTELKEVVDDGHGQASAVVTSTGERIECEFVGLTAGVSPNIELAKRCGLPVGRGVLVDRSLQTRDASVWAAGDCAEIVGEAGQRGLVQQVWYTGRMQGDVAAAGMAGSPRAYDPGVWFNSAKFLDLEYQVYGSVNLSVPGERSSYWERQDGRASLRLVHKDAALIGVNAMGLRLRHEVCERWIREAAPVHHVIENLSEANFDPEFFRRREPEIARALEGQLA